MVSPIAGTLLIFGAAMLIGGWLADWSYDGGPARYSSAVWRSLRWVGLVSCICGGLLFVVETIA